MPAPIKNIPFAKIWDVIRSFVLHDGVTRLRVEQQADGRGWTVTPLSGNE